MNYMNSFDENSLTNNQHYHFVIAKLMRIKKYEHWKFNNSLCANMFSANKPKNFPIFSISQLLETPKRKNFSEDQHHEFIFTDPHSTTPPFSINRRILNKKSVQINQLVKPSDKTIRQENIKTKIKQRIKEEYLNENFIQSPKTFFSKQIPQNYPLKVFQYAKPQPREGKVYIKGNSVAFNSFDEKKRSKSTLIRTSLPDFNKKGRLSKVQKVMLPEKEKIFKHKFYSVEIKRKQSQTEMKRKNSTSMATREKTLSYAKHKNSFKQIQPWQIDDGPQAFEI